MDDLASLRATLDRLDGEVLALAKERAQVVAAIGATKKASGGALFDRERERRVLALARQRSEALGLDPNLGEALLRTLVEGSHSDQGHTLRAQTSRSFCIVGGGGRMGRLLGAALTDRGHTVRCIEQGEPLDVEGADIVMLAVGMAHQQALAAKVGPRMSAGSLLCDINSLKAGVCSAMEAAWSGEVLGLHPMFGPTVGTLRRQKVVVCSVRPGPLGEWLSSELAAMGLERVVCTPDEHDRMMAVVQVLVHFNTLVMGEALRRNGVPVARSLEFTSPIYRLELAFTGRLFAQSADLYAEIEMSNPHGPEVRQHFQDAVGAVRDLIDHGDRDGFRALFDQVSAFFGGFEEESMRLSDVVIDTLVSRP
jgi:chorismate mutase / prephenate dehydrogenase